MNMLINYIRILLIFILCLLLLSCNNTASTKKANITGLILLSDNGQLQEDNSGIVFAVYSLCSLPEGYAETISENPSLPNILSQQTEFDHRRYSPLYESTTDIHGSFELTGVLPGRYNLVFMKEGWSTRYILNYEISSGENTLSLEPNSTDPLTMLPCLVLSGAIANNVSIQRNQNCIVQSDVMMLEGSTFSINQGAIIRINPGVKLSIYGNIETFSVADELFKITSNDGFDATFPISQINRFDSIRIQESCVVSGGEISWGVIEYSSNGLYISNQDLQLRNLVFKENVTGLNIVNSERVFLSEIISRLSSFDDVASVYVNNSEYIYVTHSMITENRTGIRCENTENFTAENNFMDNDLSIFTVFGTSADIRYNYFKGGCGIENARGSTSIIALNEFNCDTGIHNSSAFPGSAAPGWAYITANNNNFYCDVYGIKTTAAFDPGSNMTLNCRSNFWNTASTSEVDQLIWDKSDENPTNYYYDRLGFVSYLPILSSAISSAGIQ